MRGWHRYTALALVLLSACSNTSTAKPAPSTTATKPTLPPAVTASISTAPPPSTTASATTSTPPPTTSPSPPTTESPPTSVLTSPPSCADQPNAPVCVGVTVPLPPDADVILARYRAFAEKYLEVGSHPESPDWKGLQALVGPDIREEARAEIEARFERGESLDVALGVRLSPSLSRSRFPVGYIELLDCRIDGSFWIDRSTGAPATGEVNEVRRRPFTATLERLGDEWIITEYRYTIGKC